MKAYGLRFINSSMKADSPVAAPTASVPPPPMIAPKQPPKQPSSAAIAAHAANKIKIKAKPPAAPSSSGFFSKLAQPVAIPKTPVLAKTISKKYVAGYSLHRSTTPSLSMAMTAGGALNSNTTKSTPATMKTQPATAKTQPAKPSNGSTGSNFSVLEYFNRESSDAAKPASPESSKVTQSKKRKRVQWALDDQLVQTRIVENITIKYAEELFWHPPQGFGNARDLDIGEGGALTKDTVEDEEEIDWYEPKCTPPEPHLCYDLVLTVVFDFSLVGDMADRGFKRAGSKFADDKEAQTQMAREKGVLLVTYLNEGDIPESPSEPYLDELVKTNSVQPRVIPLPQELRVSTTSQRHG